MIWKGGAGSSTARPRRRQGRWPCRWSRTDWVERLRDRRRRPGSARLADVDRLDDGRILGGVDAGRAGTARNGSRGSLEIYRHVSRPVYPWAGPMFFRAEADGAADLRRFTDADVLDEGRRRHVSRAAVRARLGRIPARTGPSSPGTAWREVVMPLSAFGQGIDGADLQAVLFSAGAGQPFRFQIDDVGFGESTPAARCELSAGSCRCRRQPFYDAHPPAPGPTFRSRGGSSLSWLVYLASSSSTPSSARPSPAWWAAPRGRGLGFLAMYFRGFWLEGKRLRPIVVGITALGTVLDPVESGRQRVLRVRVRVRRRRRGAPRWPSAGSAPSSWWWPPRRWPCTSRRPRGCPATLLPIIIGGGNIAFAEKHRADSRLRLAQAEVEHLAKVAERERIARDLHDLLGPHACRSSCSSPNWRRSWPSAIPRARPQRSATSNGSRARPCPRFGERCRATAP